MDALIPYRQTIDRIDAGIVDLLVQRFALVRDIADVKAKYDIPVVLEDRIREVIDRAGDLAFKQASPDSAEDVQNMVREVYMMLIAICCDYEQKLHESESLAGEQKGKA